MTAVAAALLVAVSLTLGVRLGNEAGLDEVERSVALMPVKTAEAYFYAGLLDLEYAGAMRDVAGQFRAVPQIVPDDENHALSMSLKVLQQATEDLRGALEQSPSSIFLADLLASTHRKRMNLLRNLALASIDTMQMNTRET